MKDLMLYVIQSAFAFGLFYFIYWALLRRETFFHLNRFYLVFSIFISLVLPILPSPPMSLRGGDPATVLLQPVIVSTFATMREEVSGMDVLTLAGFLYVSGVVLLLGKFLFSLAGLAMIIRHAERPANGTLRLVSPPREYTPFSFFNLVFLNRDRLSDEAARIILAHEGVHARQMHTADRILFEAVAILQWFNPVIWLARREIKSIHEYLADEGVLQNGLSCTQYQQLILDETMGVQVNRLTNHFNVSILKKRITMMTKPKSSKWARSKFLLALPVAAVLWVLLTATNESRAYTTFIRPDIPYLEKLSDVVRPQEKEGVNTEKIKFVAPVVTDTAKKEPYKVVKHMPSFPGGSNAMIQYLVKNINYPDEAKKKGVQGTVFVTFLVKADGSVTNVKVLRGIGSGCDEEGVRVVSTMPKWNPGKDEKGRTVDVLFNLPIKFKLDNDKKETPKK